MEIFEKATQLKLRYNYKGVVSTEDLWDLSLESLNDIAISVNKMLREHSEEGFIGATTRKTKEEKMLQLKMDVVKRVIEVKIEERKAREEAAEKAARRHKIMEILARKKDQELEGKSTDDLLKELEEL